MKFLITGGTGFIGQALCTRLLQEQHQLTLLTRDPQKVSQPAKAIKQFSELGAENEFDVVINLAGEPIADKRWSPQQKQKIITSRIETTNKLFEYLKLMNKKPQLLISGSAIGYYGVGLSNQPIDESCEGDQSFSSQLCQQWELAALQAQKLGIRICLLRTGIVLGEGGGALKKMLLPFKLGLGGKIGDGKQWMPWIHRDDMLGIIMYLIKYDAIQGAANATAPNPVTNQEFSEHLAKQLKRPAILPMPKLMVKLLMGQMGEELLLSGKKIIPAKLLDAGYHFKYQNLKQALASVLSN